MEIREVAVDTTINTPNKKINVDDSWNRVSNNLRIQIGDDLYNSWFARMEVHGFEWSFCLSHSDILLKISRILYVNINLLESLFFYIQYTEYINFIK